ncbi:MAG: N-acetyltransferase [Eubacterium sp.]|nr:N-acetyltransferase [Eubacterium sp.]
MIRKFTDTDINAVAEIWLSTNIEAHYFIPPQYWQNHFEAVKAMLLQAEIYVYEEADRIQGFIGLDNNYIAGIFVCTDAQSKGIGRQLLDYVKTIKPELSLHVYKKNTRAVKFYQREDFRISAENIDKDTNEAEYEMIWQKQSELFIGE